MTEHETQIQAAAELYARKNRTKIAKEIVDLSIYPSEKHPLTVFMAGSPGAGKTEVSRAFIETVQNSAPPSQEDAANVLRIDPDEFRCLLPGYDGSNSWLFQTAVSLILDKVLDRAFTKKVSFLLDGTLSSYPVAQRNIDRAINRTCVVLIIYVYQDPEVAWSFVQDRELAEGRRIPINSFVDQYFAARQNVMRIKRIYTHLIDVDLLVQASEGSGHGRVVMGISADQIDELLPETYDIHTLYQALQGGAYGIET